LIFKSQTRRAKKVCPDIQIKQLIIGNIILFVFPEYKDDGVLIPKNTTLIISRIPIAHPTKKGWEPPAAENAFSPAPTKQDNFNMDLSKMQGTEEDKIQAMMMQSTVDYDPKT